MDAKASGRAPAAGRDNTPVWWPKQLQADWRRLPPCDVEWLVVWNVNLGGGQEAFSVRNGYWGNHDFLPDEVPRERAYVWHAQGVRAPSARGDLQGFGGIPSRIGLTVRGVP